MNIFWNNPVTGRSVESSNPEPVTKEEMSRIWSDELNAVEGCFMGLIDDEGRVAQLHFQQGIPDDVDDAGHLDIIWFEITAPKQKGSYGKVVRIMEVLGLLEKVFDVGADHRLFEGLKFESWG